MNRLTSFLFVMNLLACGAGPSGVSSTGATSTGTTSTSSGATSSGSSSGGSGSTTGSHPGRTAPFENLAYGARGALLVGPEGGVLVSEHGGMALTILPGTFQTPTEIAITEATHMTDGGTETLYELEPAGLQFPDFAHRPIATYYLDPSQSVYGSIASFYDDQGKPQAIYNSWTDESTHSVRAPLPHFSDHFVATVDCAQAPTIQRLLTGTTSKWYFGCYATLPSNTGPLTEDLGVGDVKASTWLRDYTITFTLNGKKIGSTSPNDGTISIVHQDEVPEDDKGHGLYTAPDQISARNQTVSWGASVHINGVDKNGAPFSYDNAFQYQIRIVSRKWRIRMHWYHNPVCEHSTSIYSSRYDSDVDVFFTMSAGNETPPSVSTDYDYSNLVQTNWFKPKSCVFFIGITPIPMPQVGLSVSTISGEATFEQRLGTYGTPNDSATLHVAALWKSDIAVLVSPIGATPYELYTDPPSPIQAPTQFLPHLVSGARITHEEPNGNHAGYLIQFDEVQ